MLLFNSTLRHDRDNYALKSITVDYYLELQVPIIVY